MLKVRNPLVKRAPYEVNSISLSLLFSVVVFLSVAVAVAKTGAFLLHTELGSVFAVTFI